MNSNDLSKDTLFNLVVKYKNIIEQQADRIAELSKNVDELEEELLKTPEIKDLSDEEIYKLAEYHGLNDWLYETSVPDFARAILKKASEK